MKLFIAGLASVALAAQETCPSTECWVWNAGEERCKLIDPVPKNCAMLSCTHQKIDFRFNKDMVYGAGTNIVPEEAELCDPVAENDEEMEKYDGTTVQKIDMSDPVYDGINMRWYEDVGSCRSTISKNAAEEITIVKKLIYYDADLKTKEPIDLGSDVWLTGNGGRVSVEFTCKFASTFTAKSDEIAIEAGKAVEGKLEASGSWADSLKLEYTDSSYTNAIVDGAASVLGSDLYAKISWDVSSSLSANLHYYVNSCEVKQLTLDSGAQIPTWSYVSTNGKIKIFDKGQCAAGVVNTAMAAGNHMHGKGDWKFNFRSFSFNSGGNDRQQLECEVKFCINKDYTNSAGSAVPNECTGVKTSYDNNYNNNAYCTDGASANFQWGKVSLA